MMLMAIDHASVLAGRLHWSEYWGKVLPDYAGSLSLMITRVITHICAPGFFFFLGVGVILMVNKRLAQNWSQGKIQRHLLKRSLLLLAVQQLIENPAWLLGSLAWQPGEFRGSLSSPGDGSQIYLHFSVLATLATSLILCAFLHRLSIVVLLGLGMLFTATTQLLIPDTSMYTSAISIWLRLIAVPGVSHHVNVLYPLLPWLAISCAGLAFGKALEKHPDEIWRWTRLITGLFFIAFVIIRLSPIGDSLNTNASGLIKLLSVTKYPASVEFILLTMATNLCLLMFWHHSNLPSRFPKATKPIKVFGQSALFFYIAHLYLYALTAYLISGQPSLGMIYVIWLSGLIPLYFLCNRFHQFKRSTTVESIWRFF